MNYLTPMRQDKIVLFFTLLFAILAGLVVWKFLIPLVSAIILAYVFFPIYKWISKKTNRPKLSSIFMIILIIIGILIPVSILTRALISQATALFNTDISVEQIQQSINSLGLKIDISSVAAESFVRLADAIKEWIPHFLFQLTDIAIIVFVMFFVMYYLFVDGENIIHWIWNHLPLKRSLKIDIMRQMSNVTSALLVGQVITSILQGLAGAIGFLIFGIKGVVFWGFIMTILAFIPVVGTFLVWVPAGIILLLQHDYFSGIGILIYGALIVSSIDNLIRPKLVSRHAKIHPVTVLLGVLGGLHVFGIMGVVIGPVILSLFTLFLRVYLKTFKS